MKSRNLFLGLFAVIVIGCLLAWTWHVHNRFVSSADTSENGASSAVAALAAVPPRPTINVDGINFEISSTTAEQEQGLSDRTNVPSDYAMLFVFPQDGQYGFWMKDMDVSLDMVWLSDTGTVASVTPDVEPDSYPAVFYPPEPIRYVLETKAGFAAQEGWTAGTRIPLPLPYGQ